MMIETHDTNMLLNEIASLRGQLAAMKAIVNRLPKTADGVPVVFGDRVFPPCGHVPLTRFPLLPAERGPVQRSMLEG